VTLTNRGAGIYDGVFSPDGTKAATGGEDFCAAHLDAGTGRELSSFKSRLSFGLYRIAFSPDSRIVATGGRGAVIMLEAGTGRELPSLNVPAFVGSVAFSPDGRHLAALASNGVEHSLRVWEVASRRELLIVTNISNISEESLVGGVFARRPANPAAFARGAKVYDTVTGRELIAIPSDEVLQERDLCP